MNPMHGIKGQLNVSPCQKLAFHQIYQLVYMSLPGCISQGKTRKEALSNIKDAAEGYLASLRKHNDPIFVPRHYRNS